MATSTTSSTRCRRRFMRRGAEMTGKRILDVCGSIVGLLLTLPLLLVIAIAVKLDSPGSVLFTQVRVGRGGRPFRLYKFRSMSVGSEHGSPITANVDLRITRVGRIILLSRI